MFVLKQTIVSLCNVIKFMMLYERNIIAYKTDDTSSFIALV